MLAFSSHFSDLERKQFLFLLDPRVLNDVLVVGLTVPDEVVVRSSIPCVRRLMNIHLVVEQKSSSSLTQSGEKVNLQPLCSGTEKEARKESRTKTQFIC